MTEGNPGSIVVSLAESARWECEAWSGGQLDSRHPLPYLGVVTELGQISHSVTSPPPQPGLPPVCLGGEAGLGGVEVFEECLVKSVDWL